VLTRGPAHLLRPQLPDPSVHAQTGDRVCVRLHGATAVPRQAQRLVLATLVRVLHTAWGRGACLLISATCSKRMSGCRAAVAAVLFSLYLIYDLQLIMGGKTLELSPDDYVAASLSIYLDVINIFLALLTIIGITQN